MKIFLSWSGGQSRGLARGLRDWLRLVLDVSPWMSDTDIRAGGRWSSLIAGELQQSDFGIICITPENVAAPWLIFEAGALANSHAEGAVCPLLLGLGFTELSGPLSQFQGKIFSEAGMLDLVSAINARADEPLSEEFLRGRFDAHWPALKAAVEQFCDKEGMPVPPPRGDRELLEELLWAVRNITQRITLLEERIPVIPISIPTALHIAAKPGETVLDTVRRAAREAVVRTSLRKVAAQAGIALGATKKFIDGAIPYERNSRIWIKWFETHGYKYLNGAG